MSLKKFLALLPVSIGGRLTTSSIIDGIKQNSLYNVDLTIYDELFGDNIEQVLKNDYDLIIGYDFSPVAFKSKYDLDAKCVCYFSDEIKSKTSGPNWSELFPKLLLKDCYTFFWDAEMLSQYQIPNLWYLPHFVNFEVYYPNPVDKFDVMFAGRLDTDFRLNLFINLVKSLPSRKFAWYAIERHYQDAMERSGEKDILSSVYQGFIDNEVSMAEAINKSKIVFNMNSQGVSSLNYRTFQTIACKRLLISDYRKELSLFDGAMPYWKDFEDLKNKIEYYLETPSDYIDVTNKCFEIGRRNHHSKENVEFILRRVFN